MEKVHYPKLNITGRKAVLILLPENPTNREKISLIFFKRGTTLV